MSNSSGPLYECTYVVSAEARDEFTDWLRLFQQRAMEETGIEDARGYEPEPDPDGYFRIIFRYQATDDNALDLLRDGFFAEADSELADLFGDNATIQSRVLREDHSPDVPLSDQPNCLNCGTRLRGQYCGHCGQRSRSRLISIWQLLKEAFGDLLELDSRLWRTVVPLLTRPGQLTRDYLEGRRARYMPPFRTYLVLSVIFFVVAFFDLQGLRNFLNPPPELSAEEIAMQQEVSEQAAAERDEQVEAAIKELDALEAEGLLPDDVVPKVRTNKGFTVNFGEDDEADVSEDDGGMFGDCEKASISGEEDLPEWLKKRFTDKRVKEICEENQKRGSENFADAMIDNVPVALIVLLPIMALVLKVLYPLSRRYFVEHLLFFVHFHAFFFLMLILQIIFAGVAGLFGGEDSVIDGIKTLIIVIASFYIPIYLYKAMRHVYGQGHIITILKYLLLVITYLAGATMTLFSVFLVALLSA